MERDVVCGMQVDPATAKWTSDFGGRTYYFCGKSCKARFETDPRRYLTPANKPRTAEPRTLEPPSSTWTCPMHPEIVLDAPRPCPVCGLAPQPLTVTGAEPAN